jgi:muramoyltetrapeptide carboxypeptidase
VGIGSTVLSTGAERSAGRRAKGRRIGPGATIAVPSPASPVSDERAIRSAVDWLEARGFTVTFSPHANEGWSYVAGTPEARARDLEWAFADESIDAVFCLGGGHGAGQLLRHLDYGVIAENPKPFVGFSDITVLHAAIGQEAGLVTFWGPMVGQLGSTSAFTRGSLLRALTRGAPIGDVDPDGPPGQSIVGGVAEGELVGGTTSLLATLMGTPWAPDTRGKILLLEDVRQEPCHVDRYLTHLLNAGLLEGCAGICIAEHVDCVPRTHLPAFDGPSPATEEIIDSLIAPLGIPAVYGLSLGHGRRLATVPLGVHARLDAYGGRLEILEAGVF